MLPFGLRCAPYIFNQLSDALEWIKTNYDIKRILHILNDFFLIEPSPRANCLTSLCKLLALVTKLKLKFLEVLLNSEKIPADKLT